MKSLATLLGLLLLSACSGGAGRPPRLDDSVVTFNDFESGGGWSSDPAHHNPGLVQKGRAHSGRYALRVDGNHEYSLTFAMPLGRIREAKFRKLRLEAWAFMPSERATASLGLQLLSPDYSQQLFSDDIKLREAVHTYGQWVPIGKDVTLPDSVAPGQQLRLFMWRADATDEVLLDDVMLRILD